MARDRDEQHDPLDQYTDESTLELEEVEQGAEAAEQRTPEERAINSDTETAQLATEATAGEVEITPEEEEEMKEIAEEIKEVEAERKHKNRESTSEKAKKAAAEREAKGFAPEPVSRQHLDPLRLRGKKYREAIKGIDLSKEYSVEEAMELVRKSSYATFDASVDMHINVRQEGARGTIVLPSGNGKTKKVAVADEETIEAISNGKMDFDVLLATPAQMPKLARYAKVLGPKGLMPSPKAGTVTDDIEKTKEEISKGRVEYRADKTNVVHLSIGRLSFKDEQLVENFRAMESVLTSFKIKGITLTSTMGAGIKVRLT